MNMIRVFFGLIFINLAANAQDPITLLPHQELPIDYLMKDDTQKGLIVNHYMGTGKTYLGIGLAEKYKDVSVVILAPNYIEAHWMEHLKTFPVKDIKRYQFVSYQDAPTVLLNKDLSKTVIIMDEVHNLIKRIKSQDPATNRRYSELYEHLRSSLKIVALSGTPIYNDEYDLAYLINLVSGKNLMPFNEEQFRIQFTSIKKARSFWRGHVFESNILKQFLPLTVGAGAAPLYLFLSPSIVTPVLLTGAVGSMLMFPFVNNMVAPVDSFVLRELEVQKFQPYISKYISFYEIENQDLSEFPSKSIEVKEVGYNAEQFWFFLNFAEKSLGNKGLARLFKDGDGNLDQAYLTLNTTILQNRLSETLGAGREIGNFDFDGETGLIEAPKFVEVLKKIRAQGMSKTVVYSNYFENGVAAFGRFLERNGLKDSFGILRPDMPADKFAELVRMYNEDKIKILLLHPDIMEGISLKGTRQFHILEPVTNVTILNQVIARAVRYQSHNMLPPSERNVNVYIWKAVVGSMNLKTLKLQKANWYKRYSEMSDWSNYGQGISQIDKNYTRKKLSPDSQTYMRLESVNQNMESLKTIMRDFSIEKKKTSLTELELTQEHLGLEQEIPELDPFVLPKTNMRQFWRFGQNLEMSNPLYQSLKLKDYTGYNLEIEMPIWKNLASGFYFETYQGLTTEKLISDNLDVEGNVARKLGQIVFGFGGFLKPQVKLPVPVGDLALSLRIPFGAEVVFGQALVPLFKDQADIDQFKKSENMTARIALSSGKMGYGLTTGAALGLEYFPIEFAGLTLEGGYQATYHMFPVQVQQVKNWESVFNRLAEHFPEQAEQVNFKRNQSDEDSLAGANVGFRGYSIHGWTISAGIKLTY